jgi:16S rRNA (adenine(1408)-N(1))-methyltransferase
MAESSRRAAKASNRGGLENALFVVAAAERPPAELLAIADRLTVTFPWGSLLRGALALDEEPAVGIAALLAPRGQLVVTASVTDRDAGGDLPRLDAPDATTHLTARWEPLGLCVDELREATLAEVRATGSTWARRLGIGRGDRRAWRAVLRRGGEPCDALSGRR